MTTQFLQSGLWEKITSLASNAKRKYVAVAYLGVGASDLLPLGAGDLLIVDMSLSAVRSGQTNPYEIGKYLKAQVEVHSRSALHAKVFVFDKKAVIGSPNVSHNSQNNLIETAIVTTDEDVVSAARGFVFSLRGEHVTPAYVKSCKNEYHPSKRLNSLENDQEPALWIHKTYSLTREDSKREKAIDTGSLIAIKRLQSKNRYCTEWLTYSSSHRFLQRAKLNDLYIQVWRDQENEPLLVYPPARIINFKPYVNERKSRQTLVFLEYPKVPKCLEWRDFKRALKKFGINNIGEDIHREIRSPELKRRILGLWPTIHDE
jgi:hypothetical protein